ncbi:MAG TPA: 50S ribosomal protein L11 methyltransferase, partial [Chloroflexota bacterium]|nr:50S ribosomal protein L11 methyltransferase [Chloroflexota bacterium]
NELAGVVRVERGTVGHPAPGVVPVPGIDAQATFDGALANIVARVIAERAPALARALRPGAWLVASGIIAEREAEASGPLEAEGFRTERRLQRGDWVTLLCRAPGAVSIYRKARSAGRLRGRDPAHPTEVTQ